VVLVATGLAVYLAGLEVLGVARMRHLLAAVRASGQRQQSPRHHVDS
jgi:hypothetical protein